MSSGSYKKWSKEERSLSYRLTKKAQSLGWIKEVKECEKCKQNKGIIHLHNENYDVTLEILSIALKRKPQPTISEEEKEQINQVLWVLCWRCHLILHSYWRNPNACIEYWKEIKAGKQYPPVFKHDYSILKKDHNI